MIGVTIPAPFTTPITRESLAVVTGAGSGIGRSFAVELARRGAHIVCADVDELSAHATVGLIEEIAGPGHGIAVQCDVSKAEDVEALHNHSVQWFGCAPTLVINNAGIGAGGTPVGIATLPDWERTLAVNLWGVIHGCHHFVPIMKQAGHGGIINVASAAGFAAGPNMAAYNVSKAGVMSLSETLAAELSGTGVRVTVLCPTFVQTNIFSGELIESGAASTAARLSRAIGMSPEKVALKTLDAHDKGRLYVVPQIDARAIWASKRIAPTIHARVGGLLARVALFTPEEEGTNR